MPKITQLSYGSTDRLGFLPPMRWVQSQKGQKGLCFQGEPFNITVIQVYAPITNAKEAEVEWFCEYLQDLELTPKKMSFSSQGTGMQKQDIKRYLP